MYKDHISIFGGSSFLGMQLIASLIPKGWSINLFTNNSEKTKANLEKNGLLSPQISLINGYDRNKMSIVENSYFIINMMQGPADFVEQNPKYQNAFKNFIDVASKSQQSNVIHISCLGANPLVRNSPYLKEKGTQEETIKLRTKNHTIIRSGILFGKDDKIFNDFANHFTNNRLLCLPKENKNTFWNLCYIDDLVLAIEKIINRPEIYTSFTYDLHSGERFNTISLLRKVSEYTGYYGCTVTDVPNFIYKLISGLPYVRRKAGSDLKHQSVLKESFISPPDIQNSKSFIDLSIKATLSREVMQYYLFRN